MNGAQLQVKGRDARVARTWRVAWAVAIATVALGAVVAAATGVVRAETAQEEDLYDPTKVRDYDLRFEDADWEAALRAAGDTGDVPARLAVDGEVVERAGVRYKGLSSTFVRSRKRPFNVSVDAFEPGARMLGYDVINLNNGYSDPSFVREALITEMVRPFMPSQASAFAKVHVNGAYFGLYLAVEQVEGTFLGTWFPGSDGILIKGDPQAGPGGSTFHSSLEWEGENLDAYRPLYEVKTDGAEEEGLALIREAARVLDAPLDEGGTPDDALPEVVPQILDVDRALWFLAANNLFVNYDSYYFGHNYFLYHAEGDDLLHLLLWDTSLGFNALNLGPWEEGGQGPRVHPLAMRDSELRPVIRRLFAVEEWRADYLAHYRVLLEAAFDPDVLAERGAALQALARPGLEDDPNRLFSLEQFESNLFDEVRAFVNMGPGGRAPGIVSFARERSVWLHSLPELASPDHALLEHLRVPEAPGLDEPANVTLRFQGADEPTAVRLVYRVDGGRPAAIELQRDGDAWRGVLPGHATGSEVRYYARAAFADGRAAFHPEANLAAPWGYTVRGPDLPTAPLGDLVINELLADNETTITDPDGEFDDWVELHNRGDAPIELDGYYLSDDPEDPLAFALPDVQLPAGGHLLVWCDNDPEQGDLHADFRLSAGGESLLLSSDVATYDRVDFGPQMPDVSLARVPDGADAWVACNDPSPGAANDCPGGMPVTPPAPETPVATVAPSATPGGGATATVTPEATVTPPYRESRIWLPVGLR